MSNVEVGVNEGDRYRNRMMALGVVIDPNPRYDELRADHPVQEGKMYELFGLENPLDPMYGDVPRFSIFGFDAADEALRAHEVFSSSVYESTMLDTIGRTFLLMDEPEHRRYRTLAQPAFAKSAMDQWEQSWLRPMLDHLIDGFIDHGRADLYTEYCARFPVHTISSAFGVREPDVEQFHEWSLQILPGGAPPEQALLASKKIEEYLREIIADRRVTPGNDLLTRLAQSEVVDQEGRHRLTDDEILAFARIMIPAGAGTTFRGLGILLLNVLQRPDVRDAVKADHSLVPKVIEETLRYEPPLSFILRKTTRDYELAGKLIPGGSVVEVCLSAANRDSSRWNDPHRFDPWRPDVSHLAFATGVHHCIGIQLARMELRVSFLRLLERLPDLRLDPDAEPAMVTGLWTRLPTAVPVVFG